MATSRSTTRTYHQLIIGFGSLLSIYNFFAVVLNTMFDFAPGSELRYCFAFSPIDPRRPGVPALEKIRIQFGSIMSLGLDTILAAGIMGLVTSINSLPLEKTSYQVLTP